MMAHEERIASYNDRFRGAGAEKILEHFLTGYRGRIVFSTSLGAEDQVLVHMIAALDPGARIITLDTGRLFPETYELMERTRERYGITLEVFFPDHGQVEQMVREEGVNLFYRSVENRKRCCQVRKIEPVKRALKGMDAWISGLRREQSVSRIAIMPVEWDEQHGLLKISPLYDWTEDRVWEYIRANDIPYNVLHDKGFPSIGCQPCTRAILPGEDLRAGRWWWEQPEQRECGLHRNE